MKALSLFKNGIPKWVAGVIVLVIVNIMLTAAVNQVEKINSLKTTIDERYAVINEYTNS